MAERTNQSAPCHQREDDDELVIAPDNVQAVDLGSEGRTPRTSE